MQVTQPHNAILQRDKTTYAIVPRIPGGLLDRGHLRAIADAVEKYDIPIVKLTSGQRIALVGLKEEDLQNVYRDLGMDPGKATELCLHYVQACPGTEVCRFGVRDSLGFGIRIENLLADQELPAKLKIGVSGCQFCCAENFVRDIGVLGKKNGWTISFGGHSGNRPRIGDILATDLSDEDAISLIMQCIDFYKKNARKKERASRFIERNGLEEFKNSVL
ncbi:NAD(P)/FAD-dependent oxidoreductase [Desulfopila sp. IMCC35006]|uniref:NAD(P)/FAD-dependent oxidoreductase n=1 Tax=Desulfopila sp. IMCC35006 TaxID=2569542 RepID=UPI0010ACF34A|nr:NAD(P)/FAD-dependent oxidoreductase [Desulfopila sp. IMCC35006]TKB27918.1 NAD(P)/FAD-dependent oxidoreductase [Desulfopila sp. IMCC35006]